MRAAVMRLFMGCVAFPLGSEGQHRTRLDGHRKKSLKRPRAILMPYRYFCYTDSFAIPCHGVPVKRVQKLRFVPANFDPPGGCSQAPARQTSESEGAYEAPRYFRRHNDTA